MSPSVFAALASVLASVGSPTQGPMLLVVLHPQLPAQTEKALALYLEGQAYQVVMANAVPAQGWDPRTHPDPSWPKLSDQDHVAWFARGPDQREYVYLSAASGDEILSLSLPSTKIRDANSARQLALKLRSLLKLQSLESAARGNDSAIPSGIETPGPQTPTSEPTPTWRISANLATAATLRLPSRTLGAYGGIGTTFSWGLWHGGLQASLSNADERVWASGTRRTASITRIAAEGGYTVSLTPVDLEPSVGVGVSRYHISAKAFKRDSTDLWVPAAYLSLRVVGSPLPWLQLAAGPTLEILPLAPKVNSLEGVVYRSGFIVPTLDVCARVFFF